MSSSQEKYLIVIILGKLLHIRMPSGQIPDKPRFLMSGALIFVYKTNKYSSTHSKLCTC